FTCKESGVTTNGTEFDITVPKKHVRHNFTADLMFCSFIIELKQNISDLSAVRISSYFDALRRYTFRSTEIKYGIPIQYNDMNPKWNKPRWYSSGS
ncbi:hypothetical protein PFISCL1PPCAC_25470, partial [Pristionchus fissidentatus]